MERRLQDNSYIRAMIGTAVLAILAIFSPADTVLAAGTTGCPGLATTTVALPDSVSGRHYEIYVALPEGYGASEEKRFPVLFLADGGRSFKRLTCDLRQLEARSDTRTPRIVVGLSYASGENYEDSRRRDYTPVPLEKGSRRYGGAPSYQRYITDVVLPYVERTYRTQPDQLAFWGHSYGALLGTRILLTDARLFRTYWLGSPSFWFADKVMFDMEAEYASKHTDLPASVSFYVGGAETSRYDPQRKGMTRDMVGEMNLFASRLRSRGYKSLDLRTTEIPGKDHRTAIKPGFAWAFEQDRGN